MKETEFSRHVRVLKKSPGALYQEYTEEKADLDHMLIGLVGEVGELADCIKKHTKYNKDIDRLNFIEELGDIEFYLEGIRQTMGVSRESTLEQNKAKLEYRHPKGYTDETAVFKADKYEDAL